VESSKPNGLGADSAREEIAGGETRTGILDCRSEEEFGNGHIAGAQRVAEDDAKALAAKLGEEKPERWIVVCGDGSRSRELAAALAEHGVDVDYIEGGMSAWESKKHPTQPPPAPDIEGPKRTTLY
jgi:phage shock protein E